MKRFVFVVLFIIFGYSLVYPESGWQGDQASEVKTDTINFDNQLSAADDSVQKALETLDELIGGGSSSNQSLNTTDNVIFNNITSTGKFSGDGSGLTGISAGTGLPEKIEFIIDGQGSTIVTGASGHKAIPYNCTIDYWELVTNVTNGNITLDVKSSNYTNYPVFTSIAASAKPALADINESTDSTLSGWAKVLVKGDRVQTQVDSADINGVAVLTLYVTKN